MSLTIEDGCWICESEGEKSTQGQTLFRIKTFEFERWICLRHLSQHLINHLTQHAEIKLSDKVLRKG